MSERIKVYEPADLHQAIVQATCPDTDIVMVRGMMPPAEVAAFDVRAPYSSDTTCRLVLALEDPAVIPGVRRTKEDESPMDLLGTAQAPFGQIQRVSIKTRGGRYAGGGMRVHLDDPSLPVSASVTLPPPQAPKQDRTVFMAERLEDYYDSFLEAEAAFGCWRQLGRQPRTKVELFAGDMAIVSSGVVHQVAAHPGRQALLAATQTWWYPGAAEHLWRKMMG